MNVDKSGDRIRQMFAEISPRYDLMNHLLSLNVDRYWRWRTVRLVPPIGEAPILDNCTGTGDLALAYWRATGGTVPIYAADFCREMLEIGERKKRALGIDGQLRFIEADAQDLPFDDGMFQIVAVSFGLRNVQDTQQGLREMVRVCKSGGRVAVLEFSIPTRQPFKSAYEFYFRHLLPRLGQWLARNRQGAYEYLPRSVLEFPMGDDLAGALERLGLRHVWFRELTLGIATLYVGTK